MHIKTVKLQVVTTGVRFEPIERQIRGKHVIDSKLWQNIVLQTTVGVHDVTVIFELRRKRTNQDKITQTPTTSSFRHKPWCLWPHVKILYAYITSKKCTTNIRTQSLRFEKTFFTGCYINARIGEWTSMNSTTKFTTPIFSTNHFLIKITSVLSISSPLLRQLL